MLWWEPPSSLRIWEAVPCCGPKLLRDTVIDLTSLFAMAMVPSQNKRDKAVAPVRKDGKYVEMTVKGNWPIDIYRNGCKNHSVN